MYYLLGRATLTLHLTFTAQTVCVSDQQVIHLPAERWRGPASSDRSERHLRSTETTHSTPRLSFPPVVDLSITSRKNQLALY